MNRPCTVGLTGGLASGKSAVASILSSRGVPVFDADAAVYRLYRPDEAGARAVGRIFGPGVLGADGGVDRDALAGRVLANDDALARLNEAVHPLVHAEIDRWIEGLTAEVAVVEAALLVETGAASRVDVLAVVVCRRRQQVERAVARGVPVGRVAAILRAQGPLSDKVDVADVVIDNSGGLADLEAATESAWREITSLCHRRRGCGQEVRSSRL